MLDLLLGSSSMPGMKPIVAMSAHFQVGIGMEASSLLLLQAIATSATLLDKHYVVGADWNAGEQALRGIGFVSRLGARVLRDRHRPSCVTGRSKSSIDYWLADTRISDLVVEVAVVAHATCSPHRPVQIRFASRRDAGKVIEL